MKILKHIITALVWTLLSLYVLVTLLAWIPAGQQYLGRKASSVLARKLGTDVRIDRVRLGLFNHLTLYNVSIKDQSQHDMLWANQLSARMELLPLAEGKISVSSAQIFGLQAKLYQQDANSKPNFQFMIDSLASKDTTSTTPLNLRINSLIIRRSRIKYDRLDQPATPGKFNPSHLNFSDISTHLVLKTLTEDSLNLNVKRLSFKEQSGLKLDRLSLKFEGGRQGSSLKDFQLRMPNTQLTLGNIMATYRFRGDHFVLPSLTYKGSIQPSIITLSELDCFLPSLKNFNSTISVTTDFSGRGADLTVQSLNIGSTTGDIQADLTGYAKQLNRKSPDWAVNINDLSLSAKTLVFISKNLKGERADVPEVLVRLGDIHMKGFVNGTGLDVLQTHNQLSSEAGHVDLRFALSEQHRFQAAVDTRGINLKRLLNDERFGNLATKIDLSGELPKQGTPSVTAKGIISEFQYMDYHYSNIDVNGSYSAHDIQGRLTINDPNIGVDIEGKIDKQGTTNDVNLTASVLNLSPAAINLTDKWGDARFFGELSANFKANNINDAVGTIDLNDFYMVSPNENYELEQLHIESGYNDDVHYLLMQSDFGEVEITGDFDYHTLSQSFTNMIAAKLPTLPGLPKVAPHTHNDFAISGRIVKSDWLTQLVKVPLVLAAGRGQRQPVGTQHRVRLATYHI